MLELEELESLLNSFDGEFALGFELPPLFSAGERVNPVVCCSRLDSTVIWSLFEAVLFVNIEMAAADGLKPTKLSKS